MATVLIVDDDKHARGLLERVLRLAPEVRRARLRIVTAGDGDEGLAVFDAEKPQVVITDLLMPRMNGFRFCEELRKRDDGKQVGLVVTSGLYRDAKVQARVKSEFNGVFIAKPYQIADMARAIARLLGTAAPAAPAAPATRPAAPATRTTTSAPAPTPAPAPGRAPAAPTAAAPAAAAPAPVEPLTPVPVLAEPAAGDLAERPLPRLLLDLYEARATGVLTIRRGGIEKRIELILGHPVAVLSNVRGETLGHFLAARRVISAEQHQQALERAHDENIKLGETLVEMGVLTADVLLKQLTAQARHKITTALRWSDGAFAYRPAAELLERAKGNALRTPALVFLGLRDTASPESAARAVQEVTGRRLALTARGRLHRAAFARAFGDALAAALESNPTVDNLRGQLRDAGAVYAAVEALLLTGCIEAGRTATLSTKPGGRPGESSDPIGLRVLSSQRAARPAAPRPGEGAVGGNLYDLLFSDLDEGQEAGPDADADAEADAGADAEDVGVAAGAAAHADGGVEADADKGVDARADQDETPAYALDIHDSAIVEVDPLEEEPALPSRARAPGPPPPPVPAAVRSTPRRATPAGTAAPAAPDPKSSAAREAVVAELLRVQGTDPYAILGLDRRADALAIEAAFSTRAAAFAIDRYAGLDLGPDYSKLEEIQIGYAYARDVLLDAEQRALCDAQLDKGDAPARAGLAVEIRFRHGERLQEAGDLDGALARYREAVAAMPEVADYHDALGWALHLLRRDLSASGGPQATEHLERALALDPDHARAHEHPGRALADIGRDEEAVRHLERALDARPPRLDALPVLEEVRARRSQFQELERRYRKLIARVGEGDPDQAYRLWLALAALYRSRLDDRDGARIACGCALRLRPDSMEALRALDELNAGDPAHFDERVDVLRTRWRLDPVDAAPGRLLVAAALEAGRHDLAFLAASTLVARGDDDADAGALHRRLRPRFLLRAQRPIDDDVWTALRHSEDDPGLQALFACLEPVAVALHPLTLGDLEVSESDFVPDDALPEPLARVRAYVAGMLGVPVPAVVRRADFGDQVHVGGTATPVLLAGPEAVDSTDRVGLAFRLGRAMTYLRPGRAFAGSRPSRLLRQLLLAALSLAAPSLSADDPDGGVAAARTAIYSEPSVARAPALAVTAVRDREHVNLSRWARSLARTADRVGLLLCGDVAVAAAAAATCVAPDALDELLDWATGPEHLRARDALALSVAV